MTRLILVRHGQTNYNLLKIYQGQLDIALNETGRAQAMALKDYVLANELPIDEIWSSDMQRTRATVAPIAKALGLPIHLHAGLREIHTGDFSDKTKETVEKLYPEILDNFSNGHPDPFFPNGESYSQLKERIYSTISDIAKNADGKTVLIASHGGSINKFMKRTFEKRGLPVPTDTPTENCSLSYFEYDNEEMVMIEYGRSTLGSEKERLKDNNTV